MGVEEIGEEGVSDDVVEVGEEGGDTVLEDWVVLLISRADDTGRMERKSMD